MYGREQLEQDLLWLDAQRAEGARLLVAGKINGFQKLNLDRECDAAERECRNKLAAVRLVISDREAMIRSGKLRYWKRSKGKLLIKAHGKESPWRITTQAEIDRLRAAGYFLVELKGFPPRDGGAMPEDEADVAPPLPFISPAGEKILDRVMARLDERKAELTYPIWHEAIALLVAITQGKVAQRA
jgi:hypothetical protein